MRVCQFRHDGKSDFVTGQPADHFQERKNDITILQAHHRLSNLGAPDAYPSNFAVIVIFAFRTFDTGHPLLALSAAF
jgi:hypothetical protein